MQAERHDVTAAGSLLETFQAAWRQPSATKRKREKALARRLGDVF
jgi:hypothetical protein